MAAFYHLKLKDGTSRYGELIPNDHIKEKIWRTSEGFVFEDAVETAVEPGKQKRICQC